MDAFYFDGRSSRRHVAHVDAEPGILLLHTSAGKRRVIFSEVLVSEPQGKAPRTLRFPDGDYCEVPQSAELLELLKKLGHRDSTAVRLQSRWRWALFSLVGVCLAVCAAYLWGLPWVAKVAAPHVPIVVMEKISARFFDDFDKNMLKSSGLDAARQKALADRFREIIAADPELTPDRSYLRLYFRNAGFMGPNAFTLPGGQIVMLDKLVELSESDDELLAVLAHELGHFHKRHGVRMLIQSSVVGFAAAIYLGDVSTLVAGLSAAVLNSKYSREMELEADDYAAAVLRREGLSPLLLVSALEKLEKAHRKSVCGSEEKQCESENKKRSFDWFSSHPETGERIRRLRNQKTED
ncbi:MAG: M48 family metallopeptidase [Candidatus Accumulibacter sp.]|jgi:Zn-dependent protease with chaperone function|nr:M48 family metallopeptidase [Accumulibacter sp.]